MASKDWTPSPLESNGRSAGRGLRRGSASERRPRVARRERVGELHRLRRPVICAVFTPARLVGDAMFAVGTAGEQQTKPKKCHPSPSLPPGAPRRAIDGDASGGAAPPRPNHRCHANERRAVTRRCSEARSVCDTSALQARRGRTAATRTPGRTSGGRWTWAARTPSARSSCSTAPTAAKSGWPAPACRSGWARTIAGASPPPYTSRIRQLLVVAKRRSSYH